MQQKFAFKLTVLMWRWLQVLCLTMWTGVMKLGLIRLQFVT